MNNLDLEVLNNFLTIVSCGSISAAARRLMIAQPALSRQMQRLEAEMGCKLFERGRRIILTDAGKELKSNAESLRLMEQNLRENMQRFSSQSSKPLRIAMTPHNSLVFFERVISPFLKKYPDVRFELYEKNTLELLPLLREGEVELAIVNALNTDEFKVHYSLNDPLVAAWHRELKVNIPNRALCIKDLNGLPLGLIRAMQNTVSQYCIAQGFVPSIVSTSTQLTTNLVMAKKKRAVVIVPFSSVKNLPELNYAFFDEPYMSFPTNVVSRIS
ncbi:MAG: LysR family transcriptional regulator, partial [Oscillospiraceae bacterium]|nr:LysR family transcriptional regulator [Oscillospiraceae bacterium]